MNENKLIKILCGWTWTHGIVDTLYILKKDINSAILLKDQQTW